MKKWIVFIISALLVLSLTACTGNSQPVGNDSANEKVSASDEIIQTDGNANNETNQSNDSGSNETTSGNQKVLVAFFSATNTTQGIAEHISNGLNADMFEITPEIPYTDSDLNYNSSDSRTTKEMNNPDARPAISGFVDNMNEYDIVFIGYPIWWGEAPRIINTFLESYDFSGKTLIPFCTSGSSGIASSVTNLKELTDGATWLDGHRFSADASQDVVMEWITELGIVSGT